MPTAQPVWKLIANLGDADPIEYGGYFVYVDETGVYPPEAEWLIEPGYDSRERWQVYRFVLDTCTYVNGILILSDNPYHPDFGVWYDRTPEEIAERPQDGKGLIDVGESCGRTVEELRTDLCSEDPIVRAHVYREIGEFFGWDNLDSYPRFLTRKQVEERYRDYHDREPRRPADLSH